MGYKCLKCDFKCGGYFHFCSHYKTKHKDKMGGRKCVYILLSGFFVKNGCCIDNNKDNN